MYFTIMWYVYFPSPWLPAVGHEIRPFSQIVGTQLIRTGWQWSDDPLRAENSFCSRPFFFPYLTGSAALLFAEKLQLSTYRRTLRRATNTQCFMIPWREDSGVAKACKRNRKRRQFSFDDPLTNGWNYVHASDVLEYSLPGSRQQQQSRLDRWYQLYHVRRYQNHTKPRTSVIKMEEI